MIRKRSVSREDRYASRAVPTPLASGLETLEQMVADLRRILRIRYLRMFLYTTVTSFVLLAGSVAVYGPVLTQLGVYDIVEPEVDLLFFATIASVPMVNCGRVLFLARISGKDALEVFTPKSLLAWRGIVLVGLIAAVPFVSKQLFDATGLPNVIQNLTPLMEFLFNTDNAQEIQQEIQQLALVASVAYLYPSIILVYLSHSKLSRLYPFTRFLTIARSWSYFLLVLTILPVAAVYLVVLDEASWSASDVQLMIVFVVATTLALQFVFVRLGSIVVSDEEMRRTFAGEVTKEVQTTLSQFG